MNSQSHRFTNEKLLEILSLSQNATAIYTGEECIIQSANNVMIDLWGKDRSVIGKPLLEAIPELDGQPFLDILKQVWRTGITYEAKDDPAQLLVNGQLRTFYFNFIYRAIHNEKGEVDCILHTTTDVTELNLGRNLIAEAKKKQEALDKELALNEELANINEELAAANEELATTLEELSEANEELTHTQDNLQVLNEELEMRIQERTKKIESLYREMEVINEELMASNEELAATNEELTVTNDELLDSREKLEKLVAELSASENRTRKIIQAAPFPIGIYVGSDMRIAFVNKAIIDVWGKGDNVVGKLYAEVLPELDNQQVYAQLHRVFITGLPFEARNQRIDLLIDGAMKTFYFNYNFTALTNENGKVYGVMNTAADVTDVVLAKQAVEKSAETLALLNEKLAAINEELNAANEEQLRMNDELAAVNNKLLASQDELKLAIDAAALGTFDLNPRSGRFVGNNLLKSWFGLKPEEEIELHKAIDVIAVADRERVNAAIKHALDYTSGGAYDTYYSIINPHNPEPKIVRAKGKALFNNRLEAIRLSGVVQDVTEQVTLQNKMRNLIDELETSEKKFRSLIKQAPVAINLFKTRELIIDSANDKMLALWGKNQSVDGQSFSDALPEMVGQPFSALLQTVFDTGEPYYGVESKTIIHNNDGPEEHYFNFIYQPIPAEDGSIASILQVATEVTEQVNARKEIAEVNNRLSIAIEAGALGSTEVDLSTGKMQCNEQFKKCFGRSNEEEFTYPDLFSAMLPQYREKIMDLVNIAKQNHSIYKAEYEVMWPDGSIHWINAHGKARYDSDGNAIKMVGIVSDITEMKQDEQRKNDFIGMVSHELKTPLTSLGAYVQILHSKAKKIDDRFAVGALDMANKQVKKMTNMINGFLNVSRLESGKIHIDSQPFDMALLVKEVEEESIVTVTSHQIVFAPVQPNFVTADRDKIGQVISNFISNAVKYSPVGSTIHVKCVTINNAVQISVSDEGNGIRPEDQQKLFERYYRVKDQSVTIAGFGIGLYVCAEIIQRHNGKIWVESEVGKGATFYFSLPQ